MRFQYLGTAAAEGFPAVFCNCPACRRAAALGGKNIRTRAQALINDDLMLDLGPDTYLHKLRFGLDLTRVRYFFITHEHMDHFYPQELQLHGGGYSHGMVCPQIEVYGAAEIKAYYEKTPEPDLEEACEKTIHWHALKAFDTVQAGPYTVTALPAHHMREGHEPFLYHIVDEAGISVFYLHDTGYMDEPVWTYFAAQKKAADLISLDATSGDIETDHRDHHMGIPEALRAAARMRACGVADAHTRIVLNHFSHNGHLLYDEMVRMAEPYGVEISWDGMVISLQKPL